MRGGCSLRCGSVSDSGRRRWRPFTVALQSCGSKLSRTRWKLTKTTRKHRTRWRVEPAMAKDHGQKNQPRQRTHSSLRAIISRSRSTLSSTVSPNPHCSIRGFGMRIPLEFPMRTNSILISCDYSLSGQTGPTDASRTRPRPRTNCARMLPRRTSRSASRPSLRCSPSARSASQKPHAPSSGC